MELTLDLPQGTLVHVLCDTHFSHTFDLQELALPNEAAWQTVLAEPTAYGKKLYAALFPPGTPARHALEHGPTRPTRLLLVALQEVIDAVPWEYTYGPCGPESQADDFLVLALPFVRGLPADQRRDAAVAGEGLHIVAVPASPLSRATEQLPIEQDWTLLQEIVEAVPHAMTLERCRPPTLKHLRELVANQDGRVVHFIGHGEQREEGAILCFEQDNGDLDAVTVPQLLKRLLHSAFLVTLSACVSATGGPTGWHNVAASLARQGIPYALGMRLSVYNVDTRIFFGVFYSELARGSSVEQALFQARLVLAADSPRRRVIGVPILYTSLTAPAAGLSCPPGVPVVKAAEPLLNLDVLPPIDGPFHGRLEELVYVGSALTNPCPPTLLTIHGGGGQGKTALARQAAQRFAWAWPGGVWALSLEVLTTRAAVVGAMARALGIELEENLADAEKQEGRVRRRVQERRTLFVLDNAETLLDALQAGSEQAREVVAWLKYLLAGQMTSYLVTARELLTWPDEQFLELSGLQPEDGAALFLQCATPRSEEAERAAVCTLSRQLDGHPLSLRLLAHVFGATKQPFTNLLATAEAKLAEAHDIYLGPEHRHYRLYACIEISVRALEPALRAVLSGLWIFHAPFLATAAVTVLEGAPEEMGQEQSAVHTALHQLWKRSLLTRQTISSREGELLLYALLPTTRPYIETHLEQAYARTTLLMRFGQACAVLSAWIFRELNQGAAASALALRLRVDLDRGWRYVGEGAGDYLDSWGWILYRLGSATEGLERLEMALERAQEGEKPLHASVLNNLANVHQRMGQAQQALAYYEQALPILRELKDRAGEAATLNNLALVYQGIGQPQRALALYAQVLLIRRELKDRAGEAITLSNQALVYQGIGQLQRALALYAQALPVLREVGDRAGEAVTLNNLAGVYQGIGQLQRALELYTQALPIRREVGDRAGEAATLNNLAGVYQGIGQLQRALELYAQALPIRREVRDRAGEAITLSNQALVYQGIGQPQQALALCAQALSIRRELKDRAGEAATLNNLALIYLRIGQPQRALALYAQALPICQEVEDRAREATTLSNQAGVYRRIGQPQRALALYAQALSIRRELKDRAGEAATLNNQAEIYERIGQSQRALALYEQALSIRRELKDRVGEAATLNNQAGVYERIEQPQRALALYEQALPILREEGDRVGEAATLSHQALLYKRMGQPQQALALCKQTLPIRRELKDHTGEAATQNALALLYQEMRRSSEALAAFDASIQIAQDYGYPAGEITGLVGRARLLYQQLNRAEDALLSLERAQALFRATGLSHGAAGNTCEEVEQLQETMRQGKPLAGNPGTATLPAPLLKRLVENTLAVLVRVPEQRLAWEEQVRQLLAQASAQGAGWQQDVELFTALLALLDGQETSLPAGHPYVRVLDAIHQGLAVDAPGSDALADETLAEVLQAIREFLTTEDWPAARRVVEACQELLFRPEVEQIFQQNIEQAQRAGEKQTAKILETHRAILLACQRTGIEPVFASLLAQGQTSESVDPALISGSIAALSGTPQEKLAYLQHLAALANETSDTHLRALCATIQQALVGADRSRLGQELTGQYKQAWERLLKGLEVPG
jgi:tetratricopeptide (TPR) repeat protein